MATFDGITKGSIIDELISDATTWSSAKVTSHVAGAVSQGNFVELSGDTMTGPLHVPSVTLGDPVRSTALLSDFVNPTTTRHRFLTTNESLVQELVSVGNTPSTLTALRGFSVVNTVNTATVSGFRWREIVEADPEYNNLTLQYRAYSLGNSPTPGGLFNYVSYKDTPTPSTGRFVRYQSGIAQGDSCRVGATSAVLASRMVTSTTAWTVAGGYSAGSSTSTANRTWQIDSTNGQFLSSGTFTGSQTFADYAEYFENADHGVIALGTIVELKAKDGSFSKVGPASHFTDFLGVVSATAGVLFGGADLNWAQRYMTGPYGEYLWEEVQVEGEPPVKVRKENPKWDPTLPYLSRAERPEEWSVVGLLGQVFVRCSPTVQPGYYISPINGVGFPSNGTGATPTRLRALKLMGMDGVKAVYLCLLR